MTSQQNTINTSDDIQYGRAVNGGTYARVTVGSGWDVTVKRESQHLALVNVMSPNRLDDYLGVLDIEPAQNMQDLAVSLAHHPDFPSGWLFNDEADQWDELADRWNAIEIA